MTLVIGTDEAGYGPRLGPLVITATAWRIRDEVDPKAMYQVVRRAISRRPDRADRRIQRVVLADSKAIYAGADGLAKLERSVLAAVGLCSPAISGWRAAWSTLAPKCVAELEVLPWHHNYETLLPLAAGVVDIADARNRLVRGLERCGVQLACVRSLAVFPKRWNELVDLHSNKATVLSTLTVDLLAELLLDFEDQRVVLLCDKHGGRNNYRRFLQSSLSEFLIEVLAEGPDESVYAWGPPEARTRAHFCVRAERYLPVALASMVSKYLRELSMSAFNQFWALHAGPLRPTAGYAQDANRFKSEIAACQAKLGVSDDVLWRNR